MPAAAHHRQHRWFIASRALWLADAGGYMSEKFECIALFRLQERFTINDATAFDCQWVGGKLRWRIREKCPLSSSLIFEIPPEGGQWPPEISIASRRIFFEIVRKSMVGSPWDLESI